MLSTALIFEKNQVRTFFDENKSIWFSAEDVCHILNISWNRGTHNTLKGKWLKRVNDDIIYINEAGLYGLASQSNHREAEEFMEWVFESVLPSIRRQGWYGINTSNPNFLKQRIDLYEQKRKHVNTIKTAPPGLQRTLLQDLAELCDILGQKAPEIRNQMELTLLMEENKDK